MILYYPLLSRMDVSKFDVIVKIRLIRDTFLKKCSRKKLAIIKDGRNCSFYLTLTLR